jgi:hypothetical protein
MSKVLILKNETEQWDKLKEIQKANFVFCPSHFGKLKVLKDRSGKLDHYIKKDEYPELFL